MSTTLFRNPGIRTVASPFSSRLPIQYVQGPKLKGLGRDMIRRGLVRILFLGKAVLAEGLVGHVTD